LLSSVEAQIQSQNQITKKLREENLQLLLEKQHSSAALAVSADRQNYMESSAYNDLDSEAVATAHRHLKSLKGRLRKMGLENEELRRQVQSLQQQQRYPFLRIDSFHHCMIESYFSFTNRVTKFQAL
jgi:hypothetical protein